MSGYLQFGWEKKDYRLGNVFLMNLNSGQVDFRQRKEAFYWKKVRKAGKTKNRENNLILQI